ARGRHPVAAPPGLGARYGFPDRTAVEAVHDQRLGAERTEVGHLVGITSGRGPLVAVCDQLRQQPAPDRPACACNENTHSNSFPSFVVCSSLLMTTTRATL